MQTGRLSERSIALVLGLLNRTNAIICETALETGLRISDVLNIKRIQLDKKSFTIKEQKTGKKQKIRLSEQLRQKILAQSGEVFCFPHRDDPQKHRTRQTVNADLHRVCGLLQDIGYYPDINGGIGNARGAVVGCHSFRKNAAADMLNGGMTLSEIQRAFNHDRAETTLIYLMAAEIDFKARRSSRRPRSSDTPKGNA